MRSVPHVRLGASEQRTGWHSMRPFVVARSVRGQDRSGVGSCSCLCRGCCGTVPPRGGSVRKGRLEDRFRHFTDGQWVDVVNESSLGADRSSVTTSRRTRRERQDDLDRGAPGPYIWCIWARCPQPDMHWRVRLLLLAHCGPWQPPHILHGDRQRHEHIWTLSFWRSIR